MSWKWLVAGQPTVSFALPLQVLLFRYWAPSSVGFSLKQELCEDSEWFGETEQQELLGWQCLEPNPWVKILSLLFCCGLISISALHC